MAQGLRDLKLGRLGLPTVADDMQEGVGDQLAVTGAGVALGERKPKKYAFTIPVHGTQGDTDPYAAGYRMRRQSRATMENALLRAEGLYMQVAPDSEQNGWVLLGGGTLGYVDGGPTLSEFQLTLDDAYRVGSLRTHRPARRVELYDRRLATTPRDWLGQVFGTDYAAQAAQAITYLPVAVSDVVGNQRTPVQYSTRTGFGGATPVLPGRTHGEVLSYEQSEAAMGGYDDVVAYDRAGQPEPPNGYAAAAYSYKPRLYLRLDDIYGATTATDTSEYLNNGVIVGAAGYQEPSLLTGDIDTSMGLDQANGVYVHVPNNVSLQVPGDLTLAILLQARASLAGIQGLISKAASVSGSYGWRWGWDPSTNEMVFGASSTGTSETQAASIGANIQPGVTVALAMVYTAATGAVSFYRNGALLNTATGLPTALFVNTRQVTIAKWEADS